MKHKASNFFVFWKARETRDARVDKRNKNVKTNCYEGSQAKHHPKKVTLKTQTKTTVPPCTRCQMKEGKVV